MLLDFKVAPTTQSLKDKITFTTPVRTVQLNNLGDQINKNRFSGTDRVTMPFADV